MDAPQAAERTHCWGVDTATQKQDKAEIAQTATAGSKTVVCRGLDLTSIGLEFHYIYRSTFDMIALHRLQARTPTQFYEWSLKHFQQLGPLEDFLPGPCLVCLSLVGHSMAWQPTSWLVHSSLRDLFSLSFVSDCIHSENGLSSRCFYSCKRNSMAEFICKVQTWVQIVQCEIGIWSRYRVHHLSASPDLSWFTWSEQQATHICWIHVNPKNHL